MRNLSHGNYSPGRDLNTGPLPNTNQCQPNLDAFSYISCNLHIFCTDNLSRRSTLCNETLYKNASLSVQLSPN